MDDINLENDPVNFNEAMSLPDAIEWLNAMNDVIDSINKNKVLELTDLLSYIEAIGYK